ncbi:serine carboxypeptidase-like 20 [Brassica rapa]|uniref:serine carboxypeptidase-like 20 n=1 Tax=Brassica campestris TaxID=3711 RepID=UPI00142DD7CA|nr:serine carboxypeptidase-like 20 [Brassica rapa]
MCCGQVSNIIYLDSPIGVGFSYSKNKSDYDQTSDTKTASDSHNFLIEGYLVGNGVTDPVFDGNGMVPSVHGMGLISDELFEETEAACKGKYYDDNGTYMSDECSHKVGKVIDALGLIDPSNILEPCDVQRSSMSHIAIGSLPVRRKMFRREWPLGILPSCGYHDRIVPYTGSEAWTNSMGYKVVDEWRQWMSNDQVAGYTHGVQDIPFQKPNLVKHWTSIDAFWLEKRLRHPSCLKAGVDQLLERLQHEESDIAGCGATIGKGQSEAYGAGRGCPKVGMLIRA